MGSVGWADAALETDEGSNEGNTAIRSSEGTRGVVVARVSLEVQRDEKIGFAAAFDLFEAPQEV